MESSVLVSSCGEETKGNNHQRYQIFLFLSSISYLIKIEKMDYKLDENFICKHKEQSRRSLTIKYSAGHLMGITQLKEGGKIYQKQSRALRQVGGDFFEHRKSRGAYLFSSRKSWGMNFFVTKKSRGNHFFNHM